MTILAVAALNVLLGSVGKRGGIVRHSAASQAVCRS